MATSIVSLLDSANGNLTVLRDTFFNGFAASPTYRGTTDILWTCIITMIACVYTCIHLHVPKQGAGIWRQYGTKAKWVLVALLAPELILASATQEYLDARKLVKNLNKMNGRCEDDSSTKDDPESGVDTKDNAERPKFSLSYGFFVVMGGLEVSTAHIHQTQASIILTPQGVELLARNGHFIHVPDRLIAHYSKTNSFAKSLVCIQVLWMVLQCSIRAAYGFPIALLEIHTIASVVCAIMIYILWWKKPFDVMVPHLVSSEKFDDILALILMSVGEVGEIDQFVLWKAPTVESNLEQKEPHGNVLAIPTEMTSSSVQRDPEYNLASQDGLIFLGPGQRLACGFEVSLTRNLYVRLDQRARRRWLLCIAALSKSNVWETAEYPIFFLRGEEFWESSDPLANDSYRLGLTGNYRRNKKARMPTVTVGTFKGRASAAVHQGIQNKIMGFEFDFVEFLQHPFDAIERLRDSAWIALVLFPIAYGGVHLIGRGLSFPSLVERALWQISCIGIMAFGPGVMFLFFLPIVFTHILYRELHVLLSLNASLYLRIKDVGRWIRTGLWTLLVFSYSLARMFLLVEAFISLRRVPLGVFVTLNWLQSIPHF